ncbi:VOC family protein [Modestobacter sp. DSM 44400]|uniref:VOC family protein n=1 Tax=Modestobacter sp. DSM 44400 TaxID=1550230 RepID=UPI001587D367
MLELAVYALGIPAVRPFWKAVLGYVDEPAERDDPTGGLVDPAGQLPAVWFQQMDAPRSKRNRVHLDVTVAPTKGRCPSVRPGGRRAAARRIGGPRVLGTRPCRGRRGVRAPGRTGTPPARELVPRQATLALSEGWALTGSSDAWNCHAAHFVSRSAHWSRLSCADRWDEGWLPR